MYCTHCDLRSLGNYSDPSGVFEVAAATGSDPVRAIELIGPSILSVQGPFPDWLEHADWERENDMGAGGSRR